MNPQAAYDRWTRAVLEENKEEANDAHEDLTGWLERGGFEPSWGVNGRKQFFSYNPFTGRIE